MPRDQQRMRRRHRPASFHDHAPRQTWWERWRARVLGWGALAGAVAAVIGLGPAIIDLWPDPDPEDAGAITHVDVVSPVLLSEHRVRASAREQPDTSLRSPPVRPIAGSDHLGVLTVLAAAPVDDTAPVDDQDDAAPVDGQVDRDQPNTSGDDGAEERDGGSSQDEQLGTDAGGASEGRGFEEPGDAPSDSDEQQEDDVPQRPAGSEPTLATPPPTEPSGSSAVRVLPPVASTTVRPPLISAMEAGELNTAWCGDEVSRAAQEECEADVGDTLIPFISNGAQSPEGSELAAVDVADALIEFFEDVRTVETPVESGRAGGADRRKAVLEPVGASLTANIELTGLRGQTVDLAWSIFKVGGDGDPLLGRWLGTIPAYRLQPSTDHDTTSVPLWTPLPPDTGRYFVRLTLSIDGTALGSADSPEFGDDIAGDPG